MNRRQKKKQQKRFLHSICIDDGYIIKIIQDTFKRGKPIVKAWLITNITPISCNHGDNITPCNIEFKCAGYTAPPKLNGLATEMIKIWANIVKDPADITDYKGLSNPQTVNIDDETIIECNDIYNNLHGINSLIEQTRLQILIESFDNDIQNNLRKDVNTVGNS